MKYNDQLLPVASAKLINNYDKLNYQQQPLISNNVNNTQRNHYHHFTMNDKVT